MATTTETREPRSGQKGLTHAGSIGCGLFLSAIAFGQSALAQDWEFEPSIELIATYTDNLLLAGDGFEVESFVGQVIPGFTLVKEDGRFTTDTSYRAQALFFEEDSDLDTVFHQLTADATIEALPESFFIDLDASIEQAVIDPSRGIAASNVVATDNLGDVTYANVNPYVVQRLGSSNAFVRADYAYGIGRYEDFGVATFSRVDDFTEDQLGLYVGTEEDETGFEWSLTYNAQSIDYDVVTDYEFERAGASLGIPVSRSFRLILLGGLESDVLEGRDVGGLDSDYWEAGVRINAGQNKSIELRTGERFFGTTYFGNIEFEGRVMTASVTYTENPTTSALDGPGSAATTFTVGELDPLFEDDPIADDFLLVPVRAEVYVSKLLRSRIEFAGNRTLFVVTFYDEQREFLEAVDGTVDAEDGQSAITAALRYELGARTALDLSATLAKYDYVDTDVTTDIETVVLSVLRSLGANTDLRLSLRHSDQETDSVSGFDNYTEDAIELSFLRRF
ncbi:MAG: TIGR03016 family PEP-CTERM system-associated outer membrane protein [Woeseiaceae bacterium]|nr:TIGR03016 family PEP-CTERM system-associated outer membrane protein [Woeseiaceae bacterium]